MDYARRGRRSDPILSANTSNRGSHFLNAFGRLKPGATVSQADQDLRAIAANLAKQYPNTNTQAMIRLGKRKWTALIGDTRTAL